MNQVELSAYRQLGLDRLEQLLLALPEEVHEADYFVDRTLRNLSNAPDKPEDELPYIRLYGSGKTLDEYREIATDALQILAMPLPDLQKFDEEVDQYIRILSGLPERPADFNPYVRLFMLPKIPPTYVSAEQVLEIVGSKELKSRIEALTPGLNETFDKFQINTKLRISHFLAQVIHESGGFRWLREIWGPTDIQRRYEGRKDLGNIQPGDGKRFMGRGVIQLTGRANYTQFSQAVGVDFVHQPELLEQPPYAVMVAGWYWDNRKINLPADNDDVVRVTRLINGGTIGLADRKKYLIRAKQVLGV